jgi:hypothetical protein
VTGLRPLDRYRFDTQEFLLVDVRPEARPRVETLRTANGD